MRIPRQMKIGGRTIKVRYADLDAKTAAYADYTTGEIVLKRGMKRDATEAAFIHEILHHCNTTMSHALLDSISEQLYPVIKFLFNEKTKHRRRKNVNL